MTQLAGFLFQKLFWILYNISLPSDCLWFKKDCYDLQYETFFKGPGVYLQARRPNSLNVFHLHIKQFWKVMASHLVFCHLLSFPNHQARAERGLFTNKEDTIPGPSDSIGAPKMYILDKRNFGTQISMLGFLFFWRNFLCFEFSTMVPKTAQKTVQKF